MSDILVSEEEINIDVWRDDGWHFVIMWGAEQLTERLSSAKHDEYLARARHIAYITIQTRDLSFTQSDAGPWLGWYDSFSMIGFHFLPLLVLNGIEESDVGLCMGVMCHLMCWYREENSDRTLCTYYLYCPFLLLTNFTACIPFTQNVSATLL